MFKKLLPILMVSLLVPSYSKDFGVQGATFEITEQSLLEMIYVKLKSLESTNKLIQHQKEIQERVKTSIENPLPVIGITKATSYSSRDYDPSIIIDEDIKDHNGNIIAHKGTHINPLDYHSFGKPLLFIKGDDEEQVKWALNQSYKGVIIVLVSGKPLHLTKIHNKTFFFDQGGVLVKKFGISCVPAKVSQSLKVLKVEEIPVKESSHILQKINFEMRKKK